MKIGEALILAILIFSSAIQAHAASPDIRKSDFIVTANTKDDSVAISISVEWESNISITSQAKNNVRASAEMAVLEEANKYTVDEFKSYATTIEDKYPLKNTLAGKHNRQVMVSPAFLKVC